MTGRTAAPIRAGSRSVADDIADRAARSPAAPAVVTAEGTVSYRELACRVDLLAARLRGVGAGPETVCALALERGPAAVVALLAVLRAGAAFLTLDVDQPPTRLAGLVESGGARLAVTTAALSDRLRLPRVRTVLLDAPASPERGEAGLGPFRPVDPKNLAYVSHTSGSTGEPNAVLVTRDSLHRYLWDQVHAHGLGEDTTAVQLAPFGYDASIRDTLAPLAAGGRLVVLPRGTLLRPEDFAGAVAAFGIDTVLSATPTFLTGLGASPATAGQLAGLRLVVASGESLRPFLVAGGRRLLGGRLVNQYGPTECTMTATRFLVPEEPALGADVVGRPPDGVTVQVVRPDLTPVPDGVVGEVLLGGVGVARGYRDRPGLTATRFVPDPTGPPGARVYRTGDLGRRRPSGDLEYLGRTDWQVKLRGHRVEPAEVEGGLLGHPGVREAAVVGATDERGRTYLVAHVVGELADVTDAALRAHLALTLPPHMLPRRIVRLPRLPRTSSGKTDRAVLAHGLPAATTDRATTEEDQ